MTMFLDAFDRLLARLLTPADVRRIEADGDALWAELSTSGFLDALVPEAAGGAGLSMSEVGPLIQSLGRHAAPLPIAETMQARQLLRAAGRAVPAGPIALATAGTEARELLVPGGRHAEATLVQIADSAMLVPLAGATATGVVGDDAVRLVLPEAAERFSLPEAVDLRTLAATIRTAQIAGAAARVLDMTVAYANDRHQFGKPIGRQQAVQQQLAVMAEDMVATRLAAELACAAGDAGSWHAAAAAKTVVSTAAARIAATAHAVLGAIGISAEHDLQLYTRRLHAWRLADGSDAYWAGRLGTDLLSASEGAVDWVRARMF